MSKSVLVIDTQKTCMRCPFGLIVGDYFFCAITIDKDGAAKQIRGALYGVKKQDWCPLMDLPEKDNGDYPANTFDAGFVEGWNQCIDEITGGNSDD